ncbi:MAG: hypothetical protein EBZ61_09220 [Micrococcales bacterium]|nr:hypothetical protein [Micrococcales bacterium]
MKPSVEKKQARRCKIKSESEVSPAAKQTIEPRTFRHLQPLNDHRLADEVYGDIFGSWHN